MAPAVSNDNITDSASFAPARRRTQHASARSRCWVAGAVLAMLVVLAGCGATSVGRTPPKLPSGTYSNATYHIRLAYPSGWSAAPKQAGGAANPFSLIVTLGQPRQINGSLTSNVTITVLTLSDPDIAKNAAALPGETTLHPTTLGSATAFADQPVQQSSPNSSAIDTHTDYYLVSGAYEYQVSADSVSTDHADAAIASILQSLAIGS